MNILFRGLPDCVMKDDYLTVIMTGTFEGVLEDKDGNKVQITEDRFTTESI